MGALRENQLVPDQARLMARVMGPPVVSTGQDDRDHRRTPHLSTPFIGHNQTVPPSTATSPASVLGRNGTSYPRPHGRGLRPLSSTLNGLNLSVAQGEVRGFLGPNGAGKTT